MHAEIVRKMKTVLHAKVSLNQVDIQLKETQYNRFYKLFNIIVNTILLVKILNKKQHTKEGIKCICISQT